MSSETVPNAVPVPYSPEDALSSAQVISWLRPGVSEEDGTQWLREKCRPRSPRPLPFINIGRALLFSRVLIIKWLQETPRVRHSAHPRRSKTQIAKAVQARAAAKSAKKVAA